MESALIPEQELEASLLPGTREPVSLLDDGALINSVPLPLESIVEAEAPTHTATSMGALESTALKATAWTVIDYGASMLLRIVNSLVLAHLLLPAVMGQLTLVMTVIVGIAQLTDVGLAPSVIQSARGDEAAFLNTAWTLQALRGGILWLIAVLLAWPASILYHDPKWLYMLPVLALSMLLSNLVSTNMLTLSRHMQIRRIFLIDITVQMVSLIVTIALAYFHPNVWALIIGNLASNLLRLAISHSVLVPGVRNRLHWDKAAVHEIVHFGKWIVVSTAFLFFATQSDKLILGKLATLTLLGVYGIAYNISDLPRSVINAFSWKVGYPFIAKIIDLPKPEFRKRFLGYRMYVLMVGGALLSLLVIWGDLLIRMLYRPAYWEAAWMVPILALGLWHTLLYMTVSPVLLSMGKSKYNAVGNAVYCLTIVCGIWVGFHFHGILGAVIAVAAGDFPFYLVTQYGAVRNGVRPLRQDLLLTLGFVALLALEYGLRHSFHWQG